MLLLLGTLNVLLLDLVLSIRWWIALGLILLSGLLDWFEFWGCLIQNRHLWFVLNWLNGNVLYFEIIHVYWLPLLGVQGRVFQMAKEISTLGTS